MVRRQGAKPYAQLPSDDIEDPAAEEVETEEELNAQTEAMKRTNMRTDKSAELGSEERETLLARDDDPAIEANQRVEEGPDAYVLKVKPSEGPDFEVRLTADATLGQLKEEIAQKTEIEPHRQRIIHFGKMINRLPEGTKLFPGAAGDSNPVQGASSAAGLKLQNGDFIHLVPLPKDVKRTASQSGGDSTTRGLPFNMSEMPGNMPGQGQEFDNVHFRLFDVINDPENVGVNLSSVDYFERVELGLWRARMRLLTSLLLFYYFLQMMGNLSAWLHPEELDTRFEKNHHPSSLFYSIDLVESVLGITAALAGMKAANILSPDNFRFSLAFLRNVLELCFIHFLGFTIYYKELLEGKIKLNPQFIHGPHAHNTDHDEMNSSEALMMTVFFSLIINIGVWWVIITIATRFHQQLIRVYGPPMIGVTEEESSDSSGSGEESGGAAVSPSGVGAVSHPQTGQSFSNVQQPQGPATLTVDSVV